MYHSGFELVRHDIVASFTAEAEQIYTPTCRASPIRCRRDSIKTGRTSVTGAITMLALAGRAIDLAGSRSKVIHQPLPPDDPRQRQSDSTLTSRMLMGREPSVQLPENIRKPTGCFGGEGGG